jgi:hypothetical protein
MLRKEALRRSLNACMLFNSESAVLPYISSSKRPSSSAPSLSAACCWLDRPPSPMAIPGPASSPNAGCLRAPKGLGPENSPGAAGVPVG